MYFSLSIRPLLAASCDWRLMSATNSSILALASFAFESSACIYHSEHYSELHLTAKTYICFHLMGRKTI